MAATQEQYERLFDQLLDIEDEIKAQNTDKKEMTERFSEQYGVHVKAVKKMFSDYKDRLKNESEFEMIDADYTTGMNIVLGSRELGGVADGE